MIKSNSSSTSPCGNSTTSECVTWEGENIECLGIEKGQLISVVVKNLALEICELKDTLDLSDLDLKCLFELCSGCPEPEKTLTFVLELIINKICSLEEIINNLEISNTTGSDPVLNLASCFQFTDAEGDLITELPHSAYTKRIATRVCQLILDVTSLQDEVGDLQTTVSGLQDQINNLELNIPDVASDCLFVGTKSIDDAWDTLDQAFCQLRTSLGLVTDVNTAISRQCLDLNVEYGATPGFIANPENLADSVNNIWIVLCAIRNTVSTCCALKCEDIEIGFSATLDAAAAEVTLKFTFGAGTSIPAGVTDAGSTGTITDINGAVESFNLVIDNNAEIVVPVTGLDVNNSLIIEITAIMSDGTLTCQQCLKKTVTSAACGYCEICAEGEEGSSILIVYESGGSTASAIFETTTSTTTTTTAAP